MSLRAEKLAFLEDSIRNIHSEVVLRARTGDQAAFKELYRLYSRAMFNTALRILSDKAEAEDVLQESFLAAFRNLDQYRGEATFGAWLKRIVVNQSLTVLKKRMEFSFTEDLDQLPDELLLESPTAFPYSISQVTKAIKMLPDGYRTVLSLYLVEGYDHSEISEILNIDENTSKSQLSRSKRKLIELLKENFSRHE